VFFTRNPTKLGFHFYEVSTILYEFYKNQHKPNTIEETVLLQGPWKFLIPYRDTLALQNGP
jgi:hypothetical protein